MVEDERREVQASAGLIVGAGVISAIVGIGIPAIMFLLAWPMLGNGNYGYSLFLLAPVAVGLIDSLIMDAKSPRTWGDTSASLFCATSLVFFIVLFTLADGVICLVMASPLLVLGAWLGAMLGRSIQARRHRARLSCCTLVLLPFVIAVDLRTNRPPTDLTHTSSIEIDASPDQVWPYLNKLDNLPPPNELLFRAGIAHPIGIQTSGIHRKCLLSTGDMDELITESDPGHTLAFRMLNTPPSMKELNPFGEPRPEHLKGYFECLEGRFDLQQLPNGKTLLIGTSHYRHQYAPAIYWNLWTDEIVSEVQMRVMRQIKLNAESKGPQSSPVTTNFSK